MTKRLAPTEMWFYRRMMRISRSKHMSKRIRFLEKMGTKRLLIERDKKSGKQYEIKLGEFGVLRTRLRQKDQMEHMQ